MQLGRYGMIVPLTKVPIYRKAKLESGRRELELIKKLGKLIKMYVSKKLDGIQSLSINPIKLTSYNEWNITME